MKCSWSSAIRIFDMLMRSWDIRDQIRKLSKIAPNLGHFCPPKFFWGTPLSPKVIAAPMWNFEPNFRCSNLKIFGVPPTRFVVCASKPWPVSSVCKNFRGQRPIGPKPPKYSLPKKVHLCESTCASITLWLVDQSSPNFFHPIGDKM